LAKSTPETLQNDVQQIVRISASTEPSPTRPTRKMAVEEGADGQPAEGHSGVIQCKDFGRGVSF